MTAREKFKQYMIEQGFTVSDFQGQPFQGRLDLVPYHYKDWEGNHALVSSIQFVIWGGANTKEGDLGCVTFFYGGKMRKKHHRNSAPAEILKKAFCPQSAQEAQDGYDAWHTNCLNEIKRWIL
jgi:hypothetical protein